MRLVGLCMFHEERTPSFTVFGDSSYFCFGCSATGDVIDLHAHVGDHTELWTAMLDLANRYSVDLSQRSEKWHRWQGEKISVEDLAEHVRFQVRCRRVFKLMILGSEEIQGIEDPEERREEIEACWKAFTEGMRDIDREKRRKRLKRIAA